MGLVFGLQIMLVTSKKILNAPWMSPVFSKRKAVASGILYFLHICNGKTITWIIVWQRNWSDVRIAYCPCVPVLPTFSYHCPPGHCLSIIKRRTFHGLSVKSFIFYCFLPMWQSTGGKWWLTHWASMLRWIWSISINGIVHHKFDRKTCVLPTADRNSP